jgi:hypothetical protein
VLFVPDQRVTRLSERAVPFAGRLAFWAAHHMSQTAPV